MEATAGSGLRIVVADNDPAVVELLASDLRAEGHEIVGTALEGDTAVELCRQHQPDVLVVDYRMPPGPNGIETAMAVHEAAAGTGVVIYTNYRAPDLRDRGRAIGVEVLAKGNLRALRRAVLRAAGLTPGSPPPASP